MAKIKPFKGVRPPKEFIEEVASRPYDVLNSQEARVEAEGNEKSLYHIIKPEIDFPEGTDEHDPAVYLKAAANFNNFQEKRLVGSGSERMLLCLCPNHEWQDSIWVGSRGLCSRLYEWHDQET